MTLDRQRLEAMTINGLDAVILLLNLTIEIVSTVSPSSKETDERLIDLANSLHSFARNVTEPRMNLLMTQLATGLIATERTT
jgi:hypothetical protein